MNPDAHSLAPGAQPLALATRALHRTWHDGINADWALEELPLAPESRGAVRAILAGSLRWLLRLAPAVEALLRPVQSMHPEVRALMVAALHQIEYSQSPPPSIVNIAVDAARALGHPDATGFVNALLRRFLAQRDEVMARVDGSESTRLAHPRWLLRALRHWGETAAMDTIEANNENPPMTLRVNLARVSRATQLERLAAAGIEAAPGLVPSAIVLAQPMSVERLPGFDAGEISVQDAGAQLAAALLDARAGERVLDACAAPGGKTGHILERTPGIGELVALDVSTERLQRLARNLARLNLRARLVDADLLSPEWWDGRPFHRILLDAPCSATGVIRRHPDIKLLRRDTDAAGFAAQQLAMLERCAGMLAPGGRLVYSTCSLLAAENRGVVEAFLAGREGIRRCREDLQLLPTPRRAGPRALTDGFYYACLQSGGSGPAEPGQHS
jgi:16S rRNA (cytosine967-C5)-methyltransferase